MRILQGEALTMLQTLPDESVNCIVSSPPYWRQRDYGVPGQLGLEQTPEAFVERLTAIFSEARRVLRKDGTCWVNLGDKWASGGNGGGDSFMEERGEAWAHVKMNTGWRKPPAGYKDKDLVGVPWMLAFAMRADGWYLRQCNIWEKPNCMPESVRDRTTNSHEYVFHFTKNNDYWYDAEAIAELVTGDPEASRNRWDTKDYNAPGQKPQKRTARGKAATSPRQDGNSWNENNGRGFVPKSDKRNKRSVWTITPATYREGHYAVMPDELAEICIKAGSPIGGSVLDPFGGAGTTGLVADRLQRDAILIELNPEYAEMARKRIVGDSPLFAEVQ